MEILFNWLLGVVGIVLIGVLVDLILPEGEMQKYIKAIFSIFVVFVMISPLLSIDIDKINFDKFVYNDVSINEKFLIDYNEKYCSSLKTNLENTLKIRGYDGCEVEIYHNLSTDKFEIQKVEINIKNLVINKNSAHIDKYKEIKQIATLVLGVDENKVVIGEWEKIEQ